jgi:hypothetical protein
LWRCATNPKSRPNKGWNLCVTRTRPHQGIAQHVPGSERDAHPAAVTDIDPQQIRRKPILNGLINEYTRRMTHRRPAGHRPDPIFERDRLPQRRYVLALQ